MIQILMFLSFYLLIHKFILNSEKMFLYAKIYFVMVSCSVEYLLLATGILNT